MKWQPTPVFLPRGSHKSQTRLKYAAAAKSLQSCLTLVRPPRQEYWSGLPFHSPTEI